MGKFFGILFSIFLIGALVLFGISKYGNKSATKMASPLAKIASEIENTKLAVKSKYNSDLENKDRIHILLMGIDRRSKNEGYRSDIMILASADIKTNQVVLTSIPRDLWWDDGRINALYPAQGWKATQEAFKEITGITPDKYILIDFEDFVWLVDSMGGVPVEINTTFTDSQFPVDADFSYQTVSFTKGLEHMTGERALIFSRSRKGDFDNGDWGRMRRQHLLLKGFVEAVSQQESIFNPMNVEIALKTVLDKGLESNIGINDAKYLWDFYSDRKDYQFNSIIMDYDYVYTPPSDNYGGAWVLAPIDDSYTKVQTDIENKLLNTEIKEVITPSNP